MKKSLCSTGATGGINIHDKNSINIEPNLMYLIYYESPLNSIYYDSKDKLWVEVFK